MSRVRSILLTTAAAAGSFVAIQLVTYGIFFVIGWRMTAHDNRVGTGEFVGYLYLATAILIGVPVGIGVGVLAGSVVGPRTWTRLG